MITKEKNIHKGKLLEFRITDRCSAAAPHYGLTLTIFKDGKNSKDSDSFETVNAKISPEFWKHYVSKIIKNYHGDIEFKISDAHYYECVDFLDLPDEEKNPVFPYESFRERMEKIEKRLKKLEQDTKKDKAV